MPIVYRPARQDELATAQELVVASINDLTQRHGFGPMASLRPPRFQSFSLQDDPDGLWVADDQGRIVGFAFSWVCGDLWFLAELFVAPDQQGRGVGNELLRRALGHARTTKATKKALITFAFNTASQGLYIRHGLLPRLPLYFFKVPRETLLLRLQEPELEVSPFKSGDLQSLIAIDARVLGVSREKHHRHLIADGATKAVMLHARGECVGYAYISADGHIGPLAVTRPNAMGAAFQSALKFAADGGAPQVSAFLPGVCDAALSAAVEHQMRITFPMMLMASGTVEDWTCYLPRNPGFM